MNLRTLTAERESIGFHPGLPVMAGSVRRRGVFFRGHAAVAVHGKLIRGIPVTCGDAGIVPAIRVRLGVLFALYSNLFMCYNG